MDPDGQNALGPSMVFIPYLDDTIVAVSDGSTLATLPYVNVPYSVLLDDRFSGRALASLLRDARTRENAVQLELARREEISRLIHAGAITPVIPPAMIDANINERSSEGRPPDLNHDASDYDFETIDRVHLSSRAPDLVRSSSRSAERGALQSATANARMVADLLDESSSEPAVPPNRVPITRHDRVPLVLRNRPAPTVTPSRTQVSTVNRRRHSMQPRPIDRPHVGTRLSLLHDINESDPTMWQDLFDNAEEIWSNDWEHEQPE